MLFRSGRRNEATTYKIVPGLDYRNLTDIGKVYLAVHADDSWILLRRSITEPAFTLRLEAPDETRLGALKQEAGKKLGIQLE